MRRSTDNKYYQTENTGRGFITHGDNEFEHISGYPGNVWVTKNLEWVERLGLAELTKTRAQEIVDAAISGSVDEEGNQIVINLP